MWRSSSSLADYAIYDNGFKRFTNKDLHLREMRVVWEGVADTCSLVKARHRLTKAAMAKPAKKRLSVLYASKYTVLSRAHRLKPIFHWILGLCWLPNVNEIDTNNMKSTWPTQNFCVGDPPPPIFHWKWGSRWLPNANEIDTKK